MNLNELDKTLEGLEVRYREWVKPINDCMQEKLCRINRDGYTGEDYRREVAEIEEKQRREYDPDEALKVVLDELCPAYLNAESGWRAAVRMIVHGFESIPNRVRLYALHLTKEFKSPEGNGLYRNALAAMSMEDCACDYRDTLMALAEIYVKAEEAGIDPEDHFREVADMSSEDVPRGGSTPLSQILREFHGYAVLKERRERPYDIWGWPADIWGWPPK